MADYNDIPDYHRASTPVTTALPEQDGKLNILLVTRGHPFDRDTFFDVAPHAAVHVTAQMAHTEGFQK